MRAVVLVGGFALWALEAGPDLRADAYAIAFLYDLVYKRQRFETPALAE